MNYKKLKLKNGIVIHLFPESGVETVSITAYLRGFASSYDEKGKEGQHSVLLGLMQRKTKKFKNYNSLNGYIESAGGSFSIAVSRELSALTVHLPSEGISIGIEVMSEVLNEAILDKGEFKKEVLKDIGILSALRSDPQKFTMNCFFELIYQGTSFAHGSMGSIKSLEKLNFTDLENLYERSKRAEVVFVVVGKFDEELILSEIKARFSSRVASSELALPTFSEEKVDKQVRMIEDELGEATIFLGKRIKNVVNQYYIESIVLNSILGRGFGSLLQLEIREARSLVYSTYSSIDRNKGLSAIFTFAGVNEENSLEALKLMKDQIERLASGDFKKSNLERAKMLSLGMMIVGTEGLASKTAFYGSRILRGLEVIDFDELKTLIMKVTKDDIINMAKDTLGEEYFVATNGLNRKNLSKIKEIING